MFDTKYTNPILIKLRKGDLTDPYIEKTEVKPVINNMILLDEIPDELDHVLVDGYSEVIVNNNANLINLTSTQFIVDYNTGWLLFNSSENNKNLTIKYKGKGVILYPASRIYFENSIASCDNLEDFAKLIESKTTTINSLFTDTVNNINNIKDGTLNDMVGKINTFNTDLQNLLDLYKQKSIDMYADYIKQVDEELLRNIAYMNQKKQEFVDYVNAFIDYIDRYIVRAEEEIDKMETYIGFCNQATQEAKAATQTSIQQTEECKIATQNAIDATTSLEVVKDETVKATQEAKIATQDAIDETKKMYYDRMNLRVIWQTPVPSYVDIANTYPHPEVGWSVQTEDNGQSYRWDGANWVFFQTATTSVPMANEKVDGLFSKEDFVKLKHIQDGAERNLTGEDLKLNLPAYFRRKTMVFVIADREIRPGTQGIILQFPYVGKITAVRGFCNLSGNDYTEINIMKIGKNDYLNNVDSWSFILQSGSSIIFPFGARVSNTPIITDTSVNEGDYFKLFITKVNTSIKYITIEIDVEI